MPRQARSQSPTGYYHVMMRGNNRENIFRKDWQKTAFLDSLKKQEEEGLINIVAYCLMDNHVHIVLKAETCDMAKAIKITNSLFALKFNREGNRIGHVFQDRYKSEIILDDKYLLQVIRYIHNNPLKAKMVQVHGVYKWSSYNEYLNETKILGECQKEFILGCFSNINSFVEFHEQYDNNEYLEIDEDLQKVRMEKGQDIISKYFKEKGIFEARQVMKNPVHLEVIICELLKESKLNHRQIGNLIGVSKSLVHRINLKKE